jgi:hypothetical protein
VSGLGRVAKPTLYKLRESWHGCAGLRELGGCMLQSRHALLNGDRKAMVLVDDDEQAHDKQGGDDEAHRQPCMKSSPTHIHHMLCVT